MDRLSKSALAGAIGVLLAIAAATVGAQNGTLPTPYHEVANWAKLPAGSKWAGGQAADPASNGDIWTFNRADPPILRFDRIFDQDGRFLDQWKQFGRPSGVFIDAKDNLYVADSQSNSRTNPGYTRGIRIGSARDGKVTALIPFVEPDPEKNNNNGVEGVGADANGNVYAAEVSTGMFRKYAK